MPYPCSTRCWGSLHFTWPRRANLSRPIGYQFLRPSPWGIRCRSPFTRRLSEGMDPCPRQPHSLAHSPTPQPSPHHPSNPTQHRQPLYLTSHRASPPGKSSRYQGQHSPQPNGMLPFGPVGRRNGWLWCTAWALPASCTSNAVLRMAHSPRIRSWLLWVRWQPPPYEATSPQSNRSWPSTRHRAFAQFRN